MHTNKIIIALLISLGLLMRAPIITHGLPFIIYPDDNYVINPAVNLAVNLKWNPNQFGLPDSTLFYSNAITTKIGFALAKKFGITISKTLYEVYENRELWLYALARLWNFLYGAFIILLTFALARKFFHNRIAAIFAALNIILSAILIEHTIYIRPDIPLTFFILLTLWSATRIQKHGLLINYIMTGFALGMTVATKYPGVIVAVPVLLLHLEHQKTSSSARSAFVKLCVLVLASIAAFSLITPHFWSSLPEFIHDFLYEARVMHLGADGLSPIDNMLYYMRTILNWGIGTFMSLTALAGMIIFFKQFPKKALILASFPFLFLISLSLHSLHWGRWMIPILPFIALFGGYGISLLYTLCKNRGFILRAIGIASIFLIFYPVLLRGFRTTSSYIHKETRETLRTWISENLPAQSSIAQETYTPSLKGLSINAIPQTSIGEHSFAYYEKEKINYLIVNKEHTRQIIEAPTTPDLIKQNYKDIFTRASLMYSVPYGGEDQVASMVQQSDWRILFYNPLNVNIMRGPVLYLYRVKL